jgi:hypothetical protein
MYRPMTDDYVDFDDEKGERWRARILWGHPAPAELGIHAVRFDPEGGEGRTLLGFAERRALEERDLTSLREALAEAEPANEIG